MTPVSLAQMRERLMKSDGQSAFERICARLAAYERICVFGMGNYGREILPILKERLGGRVVCVCDNDPSKQGKTFCGLRCVSVEELLKEKANIHVFVAVYIAGNIVGELSSRGFMVLNKRFMRDEILSFRNMRAAGLYRENWGQIETAFSLMADDRSRRVFLQRLRYNLFPEDFGEYDAPLSDVYNGDQYFPSDIIRLADDEVFVDGGAYTGDTLRLFLSKAEGRFRSAHLFEIEEQNCVAIEEALVNLAPDAAGRIRLHRCGLWNAGGALPASGSGTGLRVSGVAKIKVLVRPFASSRIGSFFSNPKIPPSNDLPKSLETIQTITPPAANNKNTIISAIQRPTRFLPLFLFLPLAFLGASVTNSASSGPRSKSSAVSCSTVRFGCFFLTTCFVINLL